MGWSNWFWRHGPTLHMSRVRKMTNRRCDPPISKSHAMVWIMKIGLQTLFPLKRFGVRPNMTAGPRSGPTCPQHCQKYALFPGLKYMLSFGWASHVTMGYWIKTRSWVLTYTKNYLVFWHNDKKIIIIKHTYVWNTIVSI